ncbi:hypothetical protein SAY87_000818 [Trapa incisa]|uniref:Transcriptional coactivator Hfi1/Transcriptional adapter 1 n=1 Tax=Trapa incisa TaxID=236973 RepID=A0AAN7GNP2_9MYRT|nr:hypothetical protein SAY87_000818 [Trapa incisa]
MQPHQSSIIDLGDLKGQIVKRIGAEKSELYFSYLNRFLSEKLGKNEFDKLCCRALGRENLPLHNELICSILRNACLEEALTPIHYVGPTGSTLTTTKGSHTIEEGHGQQNVNSSTLSNGIIPVYLRKGRSGIHERKLKDQPNLLGPNGTVERLLQSTGIEDSGGNVLIQNGFSMPQDYSRSLHHLHTLPNIPEKGGEGLIPQSLEKTILGSKNEAWVPFIEDSEKVELDGHLRSSRIPLIAPLGVPCGSQKSSIMGTSGDALCCRDLGGLLDVENLRRRMQHIVAPQGLGGISVECANMLNIMLDVYLKRLISSSIEVAGAMYMHGPLMNFDPRQQLPHRVLNGIWPTNDNLLNMWSSGGPHSGISESIPQLISMHDFKVAMELNPLQLGEDWPLLLEMISMN